MESLALPRSPGRKPVQASGMRRLPRECFRHLTYHLYGAEEMGAEECTAPTGIGVGGLFDLRELAATAVEEDPPVPWPPVGI